MLKEKNCEGVIDEMLKERVSDFKTALQGHDPEGEIPDQKFDFVEWVSGYVLGFEPDPYYPGAKKLLLSYGGPTEFFEIFPDGKIKFYCVDAFDSAVREPRGRDFIVLWYVQEELERAKMF